MQKQFDTIVIGAGHNGLTAAATLAKRGQRVLVCEQNDFVGGLAAREEFSPGFFSPGIHNDTTQLRAWVARGLDLERFGLRMGKEIPDVFAPSLKDRGLVLSHSARVAADEIGQRSPADAKAYQAYRDFFQRVSPFLRSIFDAQAPSVYNLNFYGLFDLMKKAVGLRLLGKTDMLEILRIGPMCVADWLNEWFENDLLKAALAGPAIYGTYLGPWSPTSNANLLIYESLRSPAIIGGGQALVSALTKACEHYKAEIRVSAEVGEIIIENGRSNGVVLADGTKILAKNVIATCDPKRTFLNLVPSRHLSMTFESRIRHFRMRGTTAKINLALGGALTFACRPSYEPEYARIGTDLDYLEAAFDAVKYGEYSRRPALEIYVPSKSDPSLAPSGASVVSILVHFASHDLRAGWSEDQKSKLYQATLNVLEEYAPGITMRIRGRQILCPRDLETKFNVTGGHIHHGEHSADQTLMRPTPETAQYESPIAGLFIGGSGAHPGGGITCAPGAMAAERALS